MHATRRLDAFDRGASAVSSLPPSLQGCPLPPARLRTDAGRRRGAAAQPAGPICAPAPAAGCRRGRMRSHYALSRSSLRAECSPGVPGRPSGRPAQASRGCEPLRRNLMTSGMPCSSALGQDRRHSESTRHALQGQSRRRCREEDGDALHRMACRHAAACRRRAGPSCAPCGSRVDKNAALRRHRARRTPCLQEASAWRRDPAAASSLCVKSTICTLPSSSLRS